MSIPLRPSSSKDEHHIPYSDANEHQVSSSDDAAPLAKQSLPETRPEVASRPPFRPLFTKVSTLSAPGVAHHPSIHYVFSSDPPETSPILTSALNILQPAPASDSASDAEGTERCIVIDLDETGTKIVKAQSLSSDFAIIGASLGPAPTWEGNGTAAPAMKTGDEVESIKQAEARDLMLTIQGVEAEPENEESARAKHDDTTTLEDLVDEYMTRLAELKRVVDGIGTNTMS